MEVTTIIIFVAIILILTGLSVISYFLYKNTDDIKTLTYSVNKPPVSVPTTIVGVPKFFSINTPTYDSSNDKMDIYKVDNVTTNITLAESPVSGTQKVFLIAGSVVTFTTEAPAIYFSDKNDQAVLHSNNPNVYNVPGRTGANTLAYCIATCISDGVHWYISVM